MSAFETIRHNLPLLAVSQAQKEITHNEALTRVDALLHPVVEAELPSPPVVTDSDWGKCWLIAGSPTGDWTGKSRQIAVWAGGSWRFIVPCVGMRVRLLPAGVELIWMDDSWIAPPQIANPLNGAFVDAEARIAITALLNHFRALGIVTN